MLLIIESVQCPKRRLVEREDSWGKIKWSISDIRRTERQGRCVSSKDFNFTRFFEEGRWSSVEGMEREKNHREAVHWRELGEDICVVIQTFPFVPRRTDVRSKRIYRKTRKFHDCQVKPNIRPRKSTLSATQEEKLGTISWRDKGTLSLSLRRNIPKAGI